MKRRSFIQKSVAVSACTIAGIATANASVSVQEEKVCKITILKRTIHQDLYKEIKGREGKLCPVFKEGQEIVVKKWYAKPEGFCDWAWADIRPWIQAVWNGKEEPAVACCTDGFRPVIMKIEMA